MNDWHRIDDERNRITDWINKSTFKDTRMFEPDQIEYSIEDIKLIVGSTVRHINVHDLPVYSAMWFIEPDLTRTVVLRIDHLIMIEFKVSPAADFCTMAHFRNGFGGEGVKDKVVLDQLARYDLHRMLKYPIIAHYQAKIAELNKY